MSKNIKSTKSHFQLINKISHLAVKTQEYRAEIYIKIVDPYIFIFALPRNQCFCGNGGYNSQGNSSNGYLNCEYSCSGNSTKFCGGLNSILVYGNVGSSTTVYNYSSTSYKGCYKDGSNRVMSGLSYQSFSKNNINMCILFCGLNQYYYAGLENGWVFN